MNRILRIGKLDATHVDEFVVPMPIEDCVRLLQEGASSSRWLGARDYHIEMTKVDEGHYAFKMRTLLHPARSKYGYYYDIIGTIQRLEKGTRIKSETQIINRTRIIMQIWLLGWVAISGCGVVAGVAGVSVGLPNYGSMLALFTFVLLLGLGGAAVLWQDLYKTRIEAANLLHYMLQN